MNLMKLTSKEKSKLLEDTCSVEAMLEFLIEFIKGAKNEKLKRKNSVTHTSGKTFLLVLDNLEGIIKKEPDALRDLLNTLNQEC